jgi:hypothetical protein
VVTDTSGSHLCSIQVKTRRGVKADRGWVMNAKNERPLGDRHFYCFVDFQERSPEPVLPLVYVMPAAVVAEALKKSHLEFMGTLGRKRQQRKDNPVRQLLPDYKALWRSNNPYPKGWIEKYRDAWEILGLEKTDPERPIATN